MPLGIAGLGLVLAIISPDAERADRPFDWIGFVLCALALSGLLYGFDALTSGTLATGPALALLAGGIACSIAAIFWLPRQAHPLLDLGVLKVHTFVAAEGPSGAALRVAINATPFLLPLLFQVVFGLDPFLSGGLVMAYFLGNLAMKSVTTRILNWFGFRRVLVFNGTLAGLSIAAAAFLDPGTSDVLIVVVLFIAGLTRSMQFTALQTLAFADIAPEHRSPASTLSTMFQQVAAVFSVALAAGVLDVAQTTHGSALSGGDFRIAFLVMGAITVAASLSLLRLPHNAGHELSGHAH